MGEQQLPMSVGSVLWTFAPGATATRTAFNPADTPRPAPLKAATATKQATLATDHRSLLLYWRAAQDQDASGNSPEAEFAKALALLEALADRHPEAKSNLAYHLMTGKGVRTDPDRALRLWREAAEAGSAVAADSLGVALRGNDRRDDDIFCDRPAAVVSAPNER